MTPVYTKETTPCRKCGEEHRVENYRNVPYYVCPHVNRVLLLVQDENEKAHVEYAESYE